MPRQENRLQKQLQQLVSGETTIEKVFPYPELLTNQNNIFSYSSFTSPFFLNRFDTGTKSSEQLGLPVFQSENEKQEATAPILSFQDTDLLVKNTQNWFANKENYKRLKGDKKRANFLWLALLMPVDPLALNDFPAYEGFTRPTKNETGAPRHVSTYKDVIPLWTEFAQGNYELYRDELYVLLDKQISTLQKKFGDETSIELLTEMDKCGVIMSLEMIKRHTEFDNYHQGLQNKLIEKYQEFDVALHAYSAFKWQTVLESNYTLSKDDDGEGVKHPEYPFISANSAGYLNDYLLVADKVTPEYDFRSEYVTHTMFSKTCIRLDTLPKLDFHTFMQNSDEYLVSHSDFVRRISDSLDAYIYSRCVGNSAEHFANLNWFKDIGRQIRRAIRKNNNNQIVLSARNLLWKSSTSRVNWGKLSAVLHILHKESGGNFKFTDFFDQDTANKMVVGLSTNDDRDPARPRFFYNKELIYTTTSDPSSLFNTLIFSDLYEVIDNKFLLEHQENIKRWGREFQEVYNVLPPQFDAFFSHFHYVLTQEHASKNTADNGVKKKLRV